MASGCPAGAPRNQWSMVTSTNHDPTRTRLLLEVAFQAEIGVPFGEHLGIDRTMRLVAGSATLPRRFMLENEGATLGLMAPNAGLVAAMGGGCGPGQCPALVRMMAVTAGHLAIFNRVMVRQLKLPPFIQMALETGLGRFAGIDNGISGAAGFSMETAGSVAGFTAHVFAVFTLRHQFGMISGDKILHQLFMTLGAVLRPHEGGPRNTGRSNHGSGQGRAGDRNHRQHRQEQNKPDTA